MATDLSVMWAEFKKVCTSSFKDETFELYVEMCLPASMENGLLTLDVPTLFAKEKIEKEYLSKMKEILVATGFGSNITITTESTIQSEPSADSDEEIIEKIPPKPRITRKNGLNPNYVFSTFVVGKSNRMAHAACVAVAEKPGDKYNPLFIWGNVGLGKTHLMHAIGNHVEKTNPRAKVLYVTAEAFTNELIRAIRDRQNVAFRSKYRELDVLMIDDVQFLAGKEQTQEEFFHTFNALHTAKKHVIISSDRPPKQLEGLTERLVSRFEWGLITDIQQPDLETRMAILQKKALLKNYEIPEEIILFIAQNIPSNIRELEGTLNRVVACSEFSKEPITIENVSFWLKDMIKKENSGPVTIGSIQHLVSEVFAVPVTDMLSRSRQAEITLARQAAMYIARQNTNNSLQQIGTAFNRKDHTTVLHACEKIEGLIKSDMRVKTFVDEVVEKL